MADFTTVGLLASIRRRAMLPTATATGTADADLLALANEELQLRLASDILRVREEYFVHTLDQTLSASQPKYRISHRALGGAVRDVMLVDSTGAIAHLPRIAPEDMQQYSYGSNSTLGYYVQNNWIVLVPGADTAAGSLRMSIVARPAELTATATDYVTVTAVSQGASTYALTYSTPGTATLTTSTVCDIVSHRAPFEPLAIEVTPTNVAGGVATFSGLMPPGTEIGSYITLREKSPIPQIPQEWHPILAQRVANTLMKAQGDLEGFAAGVADLEGMERDALALVTPRVQGGPQKIINRSSPVRSGGVRRRSPYGSE